MFNITKNAAKRIIEVRDKEKKPNLALKVIVEGGGCSGFKYDIDFIEDFNLLDKNEYLKFEVDSAIIMVDNYSLDNFINNSVLDFIETLGNKYFEIRNPEAKAKCGCGISFAI